MTDQNKPTNQTNNSEERQGSRDHNRITGQRPQRPSHDSHNRPQGGNNKFGNRQGGNNRRGPGGHQAGGRKPGRNDKKPRNDDSSDIESRVLEVKRVTRVVKGGKRTRFAALVVVGDKQGQIGYGFKKGIDFQDAVAKATKKGKDNLITISLNENGSINFPLEIKFKSAKIFMKPADKGTGLIAGGFVRPVLELAGIQNIFTKILGSKNKISGTQAMLKALTYYSTIQETKK